MNRLAYPSLLLLTLTLAACGGSGTSQPDTASPSAAAAPAPEAMQAAATSTGASTGSAADETQDPALATSSDSTAQADTAAAASATEVASADETGTGPAPVMMTTVATYNLYVATTGSDSNPGTQAAPFKTILKASQVAKPGTVVHVAPGTYYGGFTTATSGTSTAHIKYVSDTKWGAKIVPSSSTTKTAWSVKGNYIEVVNFEVDGRDGPVWVNGIATTGSYSLLQGNLVHNIATSLSMCNSNGGSGLNSTHYYKGVNIDMIGNVVHDIGSKGCKYIHGLYVATSGNVKNNIAYNIGDWGIQMWHDASHINAVNNTITKSGGGITVGGGGFYYLTITDYVNVSNNIVYGNDKGISEQGVNGTHNTYTNNLIYANGKYNTPSVSSASQSHVSGTINADPQFVNYTSNDFRVKSTSRAVNNGYATYAPSTDILNVARPQGGRVDIGAYEYVF